MVCDKKIRNSRLSFTIKKTSEQVFSQWLKCAKVVYDLPESFVESIKFDDHEDLFIKHLEGAISDLVESKSDKKTNIKGWSFGYLCGHLEGSIDVTWTNKYIIEPSKDYEDMMIIKAIISYVNFDKNLSKDIFSIYNYLIESRIDPIELKNNIPKNVVSILNHEKSNKIQENKFRKKIIDLLSNDLKDKFFNSLENKKQNCCPSIMDYFDYNVIREVVGKEHFL